MGRVYRIRSKRTRGRRWRRSWFRRCHLLNTGTIIVKGQGFFVDNGLTPGAPGTPASIGGTTEQAQTYFLVSGSGLTFAPGTDQTITLAGSIADDSSYSVPGGNGVTSGSGAGGWITLKMVQAHYRS